MQQLPNMYESYGSPVSQNVEEPETRKKHMQEMCKQYHHHFVQLEAADGMVYDGIIDGIDDDHVYLLVPVGDMDGYDNRQYPFGGYPSYGYGFGYGYPRRFRRFRRHRFPFFGLRHLFFPFFF